MCRKGSGILVNQINLEFLNDNFLINYNLINAKELKVPILLIYLVLVYIHIKNKIKESDFLSGAFKKLMRVVLLAKHLHKANQYHDDPKANFLQNFNSMQFIW